MSLAERVYLILFILSHSEIGHYNPSVSIMAQLLAPFMLCVLIKYRLSSFPNDRFLIKFFMIFIFRSDAWHGIGIRALRFLLDICWEEIDKEIFFFSYFVLMPDMEYEPGLYVQ